jgi:flagellar L-ring protein FlgH
MKIFTLFTLFIFTSCGGFIKRIHKQLDRQNKRTRIQGQRKRDPLDLYRKRRHDSRPIKNPVTFARPNSQRPATIPNRDYRSTKKRYRSGDLVDNGNQASLWAGTGKDNYLFTTNDQKKVGDIIILEIEKGLKNQISNELKRSFPILVKRSKKKNVKGKEAEGEKAPEPEAPGNDDAEIEDKVYDKVSTQVIEEISGDYILIKGRKEVIFRKKKRYLEIQALVSRRDVFDGDKVLSHKVLENKIFVLR